MARAVLERLIRLPDLSDEERQNANLISALLLVVVIGSLLSLLFVFRLGLFLATIVLFGLLILGRTQYNQVSIGVTLVVFSLSILTFFSSAEEINHDTTTSVFAWTVVPVLIANMIYGLRGTALVIAGNSLLILISPLLIPDLSLSVALGASGVPLVVFPLVLITVQHRARLESIRQTELLRYQNRLENMVEERTTKLKQANQDLFRLAQEKDKFVSNVSHELRTPITNIKLYHQLLNRQPDAHGRYLTTLAHETERLENLIESLLLLSRFDQQGVQPSFELLELGTLMGDLVRDRISLAAQHDVTLAFEESETSLIIQGDRRLITQVASILLTNALNYTPAGGKVKVHMLFSAKGEHRWAGFCVQDTGPGIEPEEKDRLFERFFRGRAAYESEKTGTGLGLAIAKEIVDRHQGRINVQSPVKAKGGGTRFDVWFPNLSESSPENA